MLNVFFAEVFIKGWGELSISVARESRKELLNLFKPGEKQVLEATPDGPKIEFIVYRRLTPGRAHVRVFAKATKPREVPSYQSLGDNFSVA